LRNVGGAAPACEYQRCRERKMSFVQPHVRS
jgi:hypothetical protein